MRYSVMSVIMEPSKFHTFVSIDVACQIIFNLYLILLHHKNVYSYLEPSQNPKPRIPNPVD